MVKLATEMTKAEREELISRQVLDAEEQEIEDFIVAGQYVSNPDLPSRIKELQQTLKNSQRKMPVTLRLPADVVSLIKLKARHEGLPYQTLVSSLLYKYAHGRLKELD